MCELSHSIHIKLYGLNPVLNVKASVVLFTKDMTVGTFDPIICSGYAWLPVVLQYTVYKQWWCHSLVQLVSTVDMEQLRGDAGTVEISMFEKQMPW